MTGGERKALRVTREGAVAEVALCGPGKGNAMGPDLFRELPLAFGELDRDAAVRAVVLRGDGPHFCYGLDLMAMLGTLGPLVTGRPSAAQRAALLDLIRELQGAIEAVARCRKPVVCAVHGWCIGGGLDLAAACDIRYASADAKFSLREVKLAIVADLGCLQRLPRIIGEGHTRELAFSGKNIDATEALRIGLVNAVYETPGALLEAARAAAREIAENPPLTVQGAKQVLEWNDRLGVADGLRLVAQWNSAFLPSDDLVEAFTAFSEKRPPRFTGA
ncbi:MAG: crotonase/enoyl-CoA hydratase family protein [Myxococcales bacterium]|nr:crotonase/enoyl-CoA hydratase family protein [Myxococcales bacterium]